MLEQLDLRLIFAKLKDAGYPNCHFYAEHTATTQYEVCDKANKTRHLESGGLSIEVRDAGGNCLQVFRTNQFSTEEVLNLLEIPFHPEEIKAPVNVSGHKPSLLGEKIRKLNLLIRKINLENSLAKPISFRFEERLQFYETATGPEEIQRGVLEQGEIRANIESSLKGKALNFSHQFSTGTLNDLWIELDNLLGKIQRRIQIGSTERWPTPQGPIPTGWSAQSMAKLVDCFLRGFEGDLVLKSFSYLNELSLPLDFNFSIREKETPSEDRIDHEGFQRKPILIFDGKNPKGLATDKQIADLLEVSPTGHARRESFESNSTIGFWHPILISSSTVGSVLTEMSEGIWVEDLEIKELDLMTGMATLYFSQVNLVHQGEIGESVEPFYWTLSLIDLMRTMTHFSKDCSTTGLFHTKQKQRILTEYTTSAALSSPLDIPGTVPKSHYWG